MGRLMTKEFCNVTRDVLYRMMTRRRPDLDFRLLGHAIQHTRMFEALLIKRFPSKPDFNFDKVPSRECSTHAVPFSSSADMFLLLKKVITECSKLSKMETFYGITNQALAVLVQDLEGTCDAALQAISKITWSAVDGVGDESPFVGAIRSSHLRAAIPRLRDLLSDRRKYFAHLCLKLATQLSHKFVGALFRCKPISTHGAEQLLLDTHSLKSFLLQMPSIDSAVAAKPPTAYVGGVSAALNKAEMILKVNSIPIYLEFVFWDELAKCWLKVVMSNMDTPEDYVEHYSTLLPDSNTSELQKVLDMRGVKKVEQTAILQAYRQKFGAAADAAPSVPVGMGNALSATQALNAVVSMAADGLAETTSMRRLEKLVKRNFLENRGWRVVVPGF
ncbi:hypothetical protein OSTOST_23380 [Ostertagia ostertagi]